MNTTLQSAGSVTKTSVALLRVTDLKDRKDGTLRKYWDRHKLENEAEKSKNEATLQTAITVNRTTARVMQSTEKQANDNLEKIDDSISP
ncbi:hypothetical protein BGZ75_007461, partial [Mortierella antarctica]